MILQIYALNGFGFLGGIWFHKVSHVSLTHSSLSLISFKIPMEMLVHNRPYFLSVSWIALSSRFVYRSMIFWSSISLPFLCLFWWSSGYIYGIIIWYYIEILICWFDNGNCWWNIIKRDICLRRALARLTRSCTKLLNGLTTIHSLSAGVFLRSQTDNPFYNIQIIYVIETTTKYVWRMILDVN